MANQDNLLSHVKPFLPRFIFALFFMSMVAVFTLALPMVIEPLINEFAVQSGGKISPEGDMIRENIMNALHIDADNLAPVLPFLLLFIFLGNAFFNFLSLLFMKTLSLKVVRNIRQNLYDNLIYQSIDFLSKAKTGDLISRISNDIEKIRFAVAETLAVFIRESLTLFLLLGWIFYRDWQLALGAILILPLALIPLIYFGKIVKKTGIQSQQTIGELSNFLSETVAGNKIVKAYNMEGYEIEKFAKLNRRHFAIDSKIAWVYSLSSPIMHSIGGLVAFTIFFIGTTRITSGEMDPGKFAAFFLAILIMYNPIKRLSQANNDYQQGKAGYERVSQIINTKNPIRDNPSSVELKKTKGTVEFKSIYFSYQQGIPVINNVNLRANKNEMVALVGASGSGKTTLMNLLLRFYEPSNGDIYIDGQNINSVSLRSLRDSIGLVTQDVFLFNDTIGNNISYGREDYSFADIKKAAKIARAAEFIEELPGGYDFIVGERGALISTGQRQRISIARAILKKPAILIFDEATSSLDSESESLIQEAMVDVMKDRTTLVIAHRLSTIMEADIILVIKEGEIRESGKHKELMEKEGLYYSLHNLQFPNMDIIM